jgi:transient-receptor-potential-like protein
MMSEAKNEKDTEAAAQDADDYILHLPRPLNLEEKKYLLAVERGDLPNVKRLLQLASKNRVNIYSNSKEINIGIKRISE